MEVRNMYILFHLSVFMPTTNCTLPHISITGLETSTDVLFWNEMYGKILPLHATAVRTALALNLRTTLK